MSIIRVLRSLVLIALALVALAIGGAVVAAVEVLFLAAVGLWSPYGCTKTVHQRVAGLSGFDFEISEMGCDLFGKDTTTSVFISKAGGTKKTLLSNIFRLASTRPPRSPCLTSTPSKYRSGGCPSSSAVKTNGKR